LSQYQLSANDPEVITKLNLQGSEFKAAIADLAYRRATKQPPSAAESGTLTSTPSSPDNDRSLLAEYEKKKAALPRGNVRLISNLQAEYRKKGLQL
jgi:hypothetical protein